MSTRTLLLAGALALLALDAGAQVALRPTYSTRDEYRSCLKEEDTLKAQRDALGEQAKTHSAGLKRIQDEMRAHVATQPQPGNADDAAVDAFNAKVEVLNARVNASNDEAEKLNLALHKFNTRIATTNQRCAGMVVTAADHEAVLKERAQARVSTKP